MDPFLWTSKVCSLPPITWGHSRVKEIINIEFLKPSCGNPDNPTFYCARAIFSSLGTFEQNKTGK